MKTGIKILVLEHDPNEIDRLEQELKKTGWDYQARMVQTREDFEEMLASFGPDIILAAYTLPSFDGQKAFGIRQQFAPHTPFIILSGPIGEENAVELIKMGVTDYVGKDNLYQVRSKIERALNEAEIRHQKRKAKEELKKRGVRQETRQLQCSEKRFRSLLQNSTEGLTLLDAHGRVTARSPSALKILGLKEEETPDRFRTDLVHPEDLDVVLRSCAQIKKKPYDSCTIEYRLLTGGSYKWIETTMSNFLQEPGVEAIVLNFRDITRKKLDEIELRDKEDRLCRAQAIGHLGFWERNLVKNQTTWTEELYHIFETSKEDTLPSFENFITFIHPADLPMVLSRFREAENRLENGFLEYRIKTRKGNTRYVVSEWQYDKDSQGKLTRIFGILQDITSRTLDRIALLQSEARLKEAQAIGNIASWELNVAEGITFWSEELFRILGADPAVVQPSPESFATFIHPEDLPAFLSRMEQTRYDSRVEDYYSLRIVRPDGEIRYTNISSQTEFDNKGGLIRIFGILQDITDMRLTEKAREHSEQKYRNLFDASPTPMWVYDAKTLAFLDVNEAAIQHYGYSKEEFTSMTLREIRPKTEIPKLEQVAFSIKGETDLYHGTFQHLTKAGKLIEVDIKSSFLNIDGRQARLAVATDISEKVRYLQAIQAQNARLKEIAWTQSHVVRAPLARLMGFIGLLQELPPEQRNETEIFDFILASSRELDAIIRDIVKKTAQIKDQPIQE